MKKRILSGMRPTGKLHLGHLVGALSNWARLQEEYDCFFMVADWHALMSEYEDTRAIRENSLDNVIDWISCGIDPAKSTIFVQSQVKEHAELHLLLSMITPLGWLERCPTYKEQRQEVKNRDLSTYAFLGYPVLQAADILIYKAERVPVGVDQVPHLELAREIVRRFNFLYGNVLREPEPLLTEMPRLLGLDNRKMSKSYGNFISLSDRAEEIKEKTQQMFTDPTRIKRNDPGHPDTCNVFTYFRVFRPEFAEEVRSYCTGARVGCTECKQNLAGVLTGALAGIREKREELSRDRKKLLDILDEGGEKARKAARETMAAVREAIRL